eukprot:364321-Chlamydomonas_euryale.AAC.5
MEGTKCVNQVTFCEQARPPPASWQLGTVRAAGVAECMTAAHTMLSEVTCQFTMLPAVTCQFSIRPRPRAGKASDG